MTSATSQTAGASKRPPLSSKEGGSVAIAGHEWEPHHTPGGPKQALVFRFCRRQ